MKPAAGIVLVHGYTGSPADFGPLVEALRQRSDAPVAALRLPGHAGEGPPDFSAEAFLAAIAEAAARFRAEGRDLVLVGHSTGGTLALAAVAEHAIPPRLLVLASTPLRVDGESFARWKRAFPDAGAIPLASVARMASLVNATGALAVEAPFPVLLIHGEADPLVPCGDAAEWRGRFAGPVRSVLAPAAGHDLFRGAGSAFALDALSRAVADASRPDSPDETGGFLRLAAAEPGAARFLSHSPFSARHLAGCPSGRLLRGGAPSLPAEAAVEPVFANIEITTRCNLRCPSCARTFLDRGDADMPAGRFDRILDLLPHAYRVTLVGLGEPLLHPGVVDLVAMASGRGRRVALATNAMALTADLSRRLVDAGLDAVAFSLDSVDPEAARRIRPGTALDTVTANIRSFMEIVRESRSVGTAVFSAVSSETASGLPSLVEAVASLGVDALMLSDLNFRRNQPRTLWQGGGPGMKQSVAEAVRKAFGLKLPVLSVTGLEEFSLPERYREHLLLTPARLYGRSERHRHCFSPWQTLPVAVDGTVTTCDCLPETALGNLLDTPFDEIWNGAGMAGHRRAMATANPPGACAACPRF